MAPRHSRRIEWCHEQLLDQSRALIESSNSPFYAGNPVVLSIGRAPGRHATRANGRGGASGRTIKINRAWSVEEV
jgi:hypothetical protein